MSAGTRVSAAYARSAADDLVGLLGGACVRLEVAGSLRRGRPEVGDVELVAEPRMELRAKPGSLFDVAEYSALDDLVAELLGRGTLQPRPTEAGQTRLGRRYKALLYRDLPIDLFALLPPECRACGRFALAFGMRPPPCSGCGADDWRWAQWGLLLLIRTGPSAFSRQLVTQRRDRGWLPDEMRVRDLAIERDVRDAEGAALGREVVPTPTEADVFRVLGTEELAPARRTVGAFPLRGQGQPAPWRTEE